MTASLALRDVEPEALDQLRADDPRALRARCDLARIHRAMRSRSHLRDALLTVAENGAPRRVLEIGCGDGTLLAALAPRLNWPKVELTLLDREPAVDHSTLAAYAAAGWQACVQRAEVTDWLRRAPTVDLVIASLFLHHFEPRALARLLAQIASCSQALVAWEPRRCRRALLAGHALGLLGASRLTRNDALVSVRAGFRGRELSAQWNDLRHRWWFEEYRAGLFGHVFITARSGSEADA